MTDIKQYEKDGIKGVYFSLKSTALEAVEKCFHTHAVAAELFTVASDILSNDEEFWTVFERFRAVRFPSK